MRLKKRAVSLVNWQCGFLILNGNDPAAVFLRKLASEFTLGGHSVKLGGESIQGKHLFANSAQLPVCLGRLINKRNLGMMTQLFKQRTDRLFETENTAIMNEPGRLCLVHRLITNAKETVKQCTVYPQASIGLTFDGFCQLGEAVSFGKNFEDSACHILRDI